MQSDGCGQRDALLKLVDDLIGRDGGAFLGVERSESLGELRVAVVLARIGRGEKLLCGGEFRGELGAIAAVGAPGVDHCDTENRSEDKSHESKIETSCHRSNL